MTPSDPDVPHGADQRENQNRNFHCSRWLTNFPSFWKPGRRVCKSPVVVDDSVKDAAAGLASGQVMLLENVRYRAEETKNQEPFTGELASLGDIFVNDAFGTFSRLTAPQQESPLIYRAYPDSSLRRK